MDAEMIRLQCDLLEAQLQLIAGQIREIRRTLPQPMPPAALLPCGHPRDGAIDVSTQESDSREVMCKVCGVVATEPST